VACRLHGSAQSIVDKKVGLLNFFFFEIRRDIEVSDFAAKTHGKRTNVKARDSVNTTASGDKTGPCVFSGISQRADQTNACNYNTTCQAKPPVSV